MELNLDHIRALADLANEKNLAEIKVENGDECITIKTPAAFVQAATVLTGHAPASAGFTLPSMPVAAPPAQQAAAAEATLPKAKGHTITAPMVGTFYRSPSPEAPPFAEVGQSIKTGQPLCIIEAMKLMNELESDINGTVLQILAENGQPVEYGQPLFVVDLV
jgi:acetyl-CoA carboxylase biotin carboxyl carrier protein